MTTNVSEFVTLNPASEIQFTIDENAVNVVQQLVSSL